MLAKRASEFVLALIPELVGNFFDCHRSLKKQVTRLLHTEPKEKLSGRDTENVFEAMAHGVVIGYLTDLVDELMRSAYTLINYMPEMQNIGIRLFGQKLLTVIIFYPTSQVHKQQLEPGFRAQVVIRQRLGMLVEKLDEQPFEGRRLLRRQMPDATSRIWLRQIRQLLTKR
jgi:hypothetical protein